MTIRNIAGTAAGLILAAVASTCGPAPGMPTVEGLEQRLDRNQAAAADPSRRQLRVSNRPRLGEIIKPDESPLPLPPRTETRTGVVIAADNPVLPEQVAARLRDATGIPVVINLRPEYLPLSLPVEVSLRYSGPLSSLLKSLASRWDAEWSYDGETVRITNAVSRVYQVQASAASSQISLETSDPDLDTGSQSTSLSVESAVWKEVADTLREMVDPGSVQLSPTAGLATVLAPPSVHRRVETFLAKANELFTVRIAIEIVAAFLDVGDVDEFELTGSFLSEVLGGDAQVQLGTGSGSSTPSIASIIVPENVTGDAARYAGSTAILHALSRKNRVVDYRSANAVTRHGAPVPISLSRKQDIVSGITVTEDDDGSSTSSIESETITTGLSITAFPRIVEHERVHLTVSLVASNLVQIDSHETSDGGSIQLPTVEERRLTHDLVLDRDELVLLAGYEQELASRSASGAGHSDFFLLGGSRRRESTRTRLILLVSAKTLR